MRKVVEFVLDTPRPDGAQPVPGQGEWRCDGKSLGVISPYYVEDAVRAAVALTGVKETDLVIVYPRQLEVDRSAWSDLGQPPRLPVAPVGRFRFVRPFDDLPGMLIPA